jgi:hypothetical protein
MRIKINQTDGTLPLITEIPSFGIGQLEGYNGVGKSLTLSVLQLCSGVRPSMEVPAWTGFCNGMGHVTVTATELQELDELRWVLDGSNLLEASQAGDAAISPSLAWFVDIQLDGSTVGSMDEVRRVFAVERINGDVGLTEQLAVGADGARRELELAGTRILGSKKLQAVEEQIGQLQDLISEISVSRIADRAQSVAEVQEERRSAEGLLVSLSERQAKLGEADEKRRRLEQIALTGVELDSELAETKKSLSELTRSRGAVAKKLSSAEKAANLSEDLRKELKTATKSYKRANTSLRNSTRKLAEAMQVADVDEETNIQARTDQVVGELNVLRGRRMELDAGPAVIELIDDMAPRINQAAASQIADQVLLSMPSRSPGEWTVDQVADAISQRREELGGLPASEDAQVIDAEIASKSTQLEALSVVADQRKKRNRAIELVNDAQNRSAELTERLDQAGTAALSELRAERRLLDEQLTQLGSHAAVLQWRRDSLGAPEEKDALTRQLASLLGELGFDETRIAAEHAAANLDLAEHREKVVDLRKLERTAVADHERDLGDINRILGRLAELPWLSVDGVPLPKAADDLAEQLDRLGSLQGLVDAVDQRLTGFRQAFPGLAASLEAASDELRGRDPKAAVRVPEVFASLEDDAAGWFADDAFREALLGSDASDVRVNLRARQVSWSVSGSRQTKPVEALSSGERAFAFTQARLAVLEQRAGDVANRLIALDEFGAFVSSNRLRQLSEYLRRWQSEHGHDQILVVLPANQDYETLAQASDGEIATRFERMAERLRTQEWFVEEFQAA